MSCIGYLHPYNTSLLLDSNQCVLTRFDYKSSAIVHYAKEQVCCVDFAEKHLGITKLRSDTRLFKNSRIFATS